MNSIDLKGTRSRACVFGVLEFVLFARLLQCEYEEHSAGLVLTLVTLAVGVVGNLYIASVCHDKIQELSKKDTE